MNPLPTKPVRIIRQLEAFLAGQRTELDPIVHLATANRTLYHAGIRIATEDTAPNCLRFYLCSPREAWKPLATLLGLLGRPEGLLRSAAGERPCPWILFDRQTKAELLRILPGQILKVPLDILQPCAILL